MDWAQFIYDPIGYAIRYIGIEKMLENINRSKLQQRMLEDKMYEDYKMNTTDAQKKTPAEVLAGATSDEEVLFADCPHCGEPIGIVISPKRPSPDPENPSPAETLSHKLPDHQL